MDKRFDYHKPDEAKVDAHTTCRATCKALAQCLDELLPESREKSIVFTKLEEVLMWANAAIARN
ncbi:MAG: hypothetical protein KKH61_20645 [Gammaproteobacteria bacterium]|nr:hypothetical protein [Gammaproteobacteria bacterium]